MWSDLLICFMHIPKCAGTSVRRVFSVACGDVDSVFDCYWAQPGRTIEDLLWMRTSAREALKVIYGHFFFGTHRILQRPGAYMTILRSPLDRVVSQYNYDVSNRADVVVDKTDGSILGLSSAMETGDFQYNNLMCRMISGLGPSLSSDDELVSTALTNVKSSFAFVGFLEEEALAGRLSRHLSIHLGRNINVELPFVNSLEKTAYISDLDKGRVLRHNKADIELYECLASIFGPSLRASDRVRAS